jgi:hypothetical protein
MSVEIPTAEPPVITAGDTIRWQISLPDYPASAGWTLKYALVSAAGKHDVTSIAAGADHLVEIAAATSAGYAAGLYQYQKYVEKGAGETLERITLDLGTLTVARSLAALATATDTRSFARRALDAIEAVIENRAGRSDKEYEIDHGGSRQRLESLPLLDLLAARDRFAALVWQEEHPGQLITPVRTVFVR